MNYDKHSFLAGLAVGRTLKGWCSVARENRCARDEPETVFDLYAAVASGNLSWTAEAAAAEA